MRLPAVSAGQAAAERLMTDTCRIERVTRSARPDQETLRYTNTAAVIYTGRCQLKWASVQPHEATPAGQTVTAQTALLKLPMATSTEVTTGMRVTITDSDDPAMVGRVLRIAGRFQQTHSTARRFPVEEYT